jgi:hypothetical protein
MAEGLAMKYSVSCSCGQVFPVEATQAGSTLQCRCERAIQVPRLSALRIAAGETAIPLNAAERVRLGVLNKTLPDNDICPITGRIPDAVAVFRILCERVWKRQVDNDSFSVGRAFLWGIVAGPAGIMFAVLRSLIGNRLSPSGTEQLGRNTVVDAPLRVAAEALPQLSRTQNQRKLRELLQPTRAYADLFAEFPDTDIKFHSNGN